MDVVLPGSTALMVPERLVPSAWLGHIPFAFWLVANHQPKLLVELGTHHGASYLAFCQAVERQSLATTAYAIDTWAGDDQAGHYDDKVFRELSEYHDRRYGTFSTLIRSTFDHAVDRFADKSIDLLHIDGYHSYSSVKHDFDAWAPKLSNRAIVLLHDIGVREPEFGVWRLWEELTLQWPGFAFHHHHGLGILCVGEELTPASTCLVQTWADPSIAAYARACFSRLGSGAQAEFDARRYLAAHDRMAGEAARLNADRTAALADRTAALTDCTAALADCTAALAERATALAEREAALAERDLLRSALDTAEAELKRVLDMTEAELRTAHSAQQAAQRTLNARTAEITAAARNLSAANQALSKERRRRQKLRHSVSWRVTRPLRSIVGLFGRTFGKKESRPSALSWWMPTPRIRCLALDRLRSRRPSRPPCRSCRCFYRIIFAPCCRAHLRRPLTSSKARHSTSYAVSFTCTTLIFGTRWQAISGISRASIMISS